MQEARFTDSRVANNDQFEQEVLDLDAVIFKDFVGHGVQSCGQLLD
jgi:hypothetical protein